MYSNIKGLAKLVDKYQLASIKQSIVNQIQQDWPQTLAELVRLKLDKEFVESYKYSHLVARSSCRPKLPDPATVIRIAMDFGATSVLPGAFYLLATCDGSGWDAVLKKPRNKENLPPNRNSPWDVRWELLNVTDMLRYSQGKQSLTEEMASIGDVFRFDMNIPYCLMPYIEQEYEEPDLLPGEPPYGPPPPVTQCYESGWALSDDLSKVDKHLPSPRHYIPCPDPISALMKLRETEKKWGLCASCVQTVQARIDGRIRKIWKELPQRFSLDDLNMGT